MRKVKWGILSTAKIAQTQLIPAIKRSTNAEVVAIASRSSKVHEVAAKFDIQNAYESYEELVADPNVDAIYIPVPNFLHKEWIIKATQAGKHVLSEKPVTLTAEEAREVEKVCRENGVVFMEGFMYQFHAQHDRVREIIASGEIGDVRLMKASFSFYMNAERKETDIRLNAPAGSGSIYDVGCYCIHSIRNVLQTEPNDVHVFADLVPNSQVDMSAIGYMSLANGAKAVFDSSFDMNGQQYYTIVGTKGTITVPRAYRPDQYGGEGLVIIEKGNEKREERLLTDQYATEVEHISECILEGKTPSYTIENSIKNMEAIEACYESIRLSEKVSLY